MHILADYYRSEFLATPQLVRLDYSIGKDGHEPSLLIKTSTLMQKYIVKGAKMSLIIAKIQNRLLYGIKIFDDPTNPAIIWSIVENESEKKAFTAIANGQISKIFLFNELALNVAWNQIKLPKSPILNEFISLTKTDANVDYAALQNNVSKIFKQLEEGCASKELIVIDIVTTIPWDSLKNHYITNCIDDSSVNLFDLNEGKQQEQLAIWLTDNLCPQGAYHSPQIQKKEHIDRELTDIFLNYEFGSFLIESKTLTIFNRPSLPSQMKLSHDIFNHIKKAINQLKGGIRQLKSETIVTTKNGEKINVEYAQPMHAIVLIPDLNLVKDLMKDQSTILIDFFKETGGFIHLLDIFELLRIVQAAEIISSRSSTITPIMAFDYYLMERAKKCNEAGTLCIEVLLRFEKESKKD
jgi:hypothetical protein